MISYFVPYKQVLEIYKESNYLYGLEKLSESMLDRLCNVDSFNVDNYIDVTNVVTHTHNWSRIEYNLNKYIDMWLPADLANSKNASIKAALLTLDITDITLLNLASTKMPDFVSLFNFNTNITTSPHPLSAQIINKISKTGKFNFAKPQKNKRQVLIRNNATGQVLMHPKLYHYWHSICSKCPSQANDALLTYITNNLRITNVSQLCHFCKSIKSNIFDYYDSLCWECGNNAWLIRNNPGSATGIRACVTGCRHTVGYFTALELLRRGADFVLGTTRFPNIALETYKKEPDYAKWAAKLHIIRADFLKWTEVTELISALEKYQINTYINNAFQTMPNTSDYLIHATKLDENPELLRINSNLLDHNKNIRPLTLKHLGQESITASNPLDCNQPVQLDVKLSDEIVNSIPKASTDVVTRYAFGAEPSWKKPIAEIAPDEMITAGVINSIVPEIIISAFRKMPSKHSKYKAIINVSSSEGLCDTQSSVTGGHKNHMQHLINCLHLEKDQSLIAYTTDPGFITGIFGKKNSPRKFIPLFKNNPAHNISLDESNIDNPASSIGLIKVLTAQDGAMRVIYPLLDYIGKGVKPGPSYR
jgi:short-subunit dehydrogenase